MSATLSELKATDPGRYLSVEEMEAVVAEAPHLAGRIEAAREAARAEKAIIEKVIKVVLRKYDFRGKYEYGEDKCVRDVTAVYRYCVFAMVCNDPKMLRDKLLFWMRTIIQSFGFPGGNSSIEMTYTRLRSEAAKQLDAKTHGLLDPFLAEVERILPADQLVEEEI